MSDYSSEDSDVPYDSDGGFIDGMDDEDETSSSVLLATLQKGRSSASQYKYESLSSQEIWGRIEKEVDDTVAVLGLERQTAYILLLNNRWNKDKLVERYMEVPSTVLKEIGEQVDSEDPVSPRSHKRPRYNPPNLRSSGSSITSLFSRSPPAPYFPRVRSPAPAQQGFTCPVCFDPVPESQLSKQTSALKCGHRFCSDCWNSYVESQVRSEGRCIITCMDESCKVVANEEFLQSVAGSCFDRYRTLILQSFVSCNLDLTFCPLPSCDQVVSCPGARGSSLLVSVPTVECSNSHKFCFGCGLESSHRPVICAIVRKWSESREDSGSMQWIKAHTKNCPKCGNNIEKSGGCNRMRCRHCTYQFCWMCMKNWEVHGYNNSVCNAFVEPDRTEGMTEAAARLERWLFYFDRFNNHELSSKLDKDLCDRMEEKMEEIQQSSNLSWIETEFMKKAIDELTKCRLTLKWTYAMAHFMVKGNMKQIFEDIQADLERAVEQLSQMLDEPVEENSIKTLRQRVTDKMVYVQKRHEVLLEEVEKGMVDGTWRFTINLE